MRRFGTAAAISAVLALAAACSGPSSAPPVDAAVTAAATAADAAAHDGAITPDGIARHIKILASDEFEGRAPTTPGGEKARNYIAAEYKRIGLEPVGGSYFQNADMVETAIDPATSYLRVNANGEVRDIAYKSEAVWFTKRVRPEV